MVSKWHCDDCDIFFCFSVMSSHTHHRAFMYMWTRHPASLTPSFLFQKISYTSTRWYSGKCFINGRSNTPRLIGSSIAPTLHPPPPPSHSCPLPSPMENTWTPQASSQRSSHDRSPVQVTNLNLRLSSHLILPSRTMRCTTRNANSKTKCTATGPLSQVFTSQPESFRLT